MVGAEPAVVMPGVVLDARTEADLARHDSVFDTDIEKRVVCFRETQT